MNTNKAIKFLEERIYCGGHFFPADKKDLLEIVEKLKHGKKFELMLIELEAYYRNVGEHIQTKHIISFIEKLKQKYFPEPKEKTITEHPMTLGEILVLLNELPVIIEEIYKKLGIKECN